jgi:hypothetical protein
LLPVLEELDRPRAENLLQEDQEARTALNHNPKGLQSIDSNSYSDQSLAEGQSSSIRGIRATAGVDRGAVVEGDALQQLERQLDTEVENVVLEAGRDPRLAFQDAMNLPLRNAFGSDVFSPRTRALESVAEKAAKTDPVLARTAMNEMRKLLGTMDSTWQSQVLPLVPDFYMRIGDIDEAGKAVRDLLKVAEKLYARDSDSSDLNLAFKGVWPSATLWRRCLLIAAKISPDFAEEIVAEIPDPDIAGYEKAALGTLLLNTEPFHTPTVEWHKNRKRSSVIM